MRGKAEPLTAWRLVGTRETRTADLGPLLGREPELRRLREVFERVAYERSPQRVVMVGPAGIGKSRLAREVGEALSERATVLVGRCLPYGEGITFWALAEIVRQLAGSAEPRAALERVVRAATRGPSCSPTACCRPPASRRRPRRARTSPVAVRDLFATLARERPVVLVLEDLHWAEPALLDLVEHLLEHTAGAR